MNDALREAEERFQVAFDHAPIGMSVTSLDGVVLRANRAMAELLGRTERELVGMRLLDLTHPQDRTANETALGELVEGKRGNNYRTTKRYLRPDGQDVWASVSASVVHHADGRPLYLVTQMDDVTDSHRVEELSFLADHDPLTGVFNRRRFKQELEQALERGRRYEHPVALMVIDLDDFKLINDTFGHQAGDEALTRTAQALQDRLRRSDVVGRLGGDEFAAVLPESGPEQVQKTASDLLELIRAITLGDGRRELRLSASVGVALLQDRWRLGPEGMLRRADEAMYEAKRAGRDGFRCWTPSTQRTTTVPFM